MSGKAVTGVGSGPNSSSEIVNVNNVGNTVNATRISRAEEFNGKSSQIGGNTSGTGRVRVQTATGGGRSKRLYEQLNKNLSITASGAMGSGTPQTTVNAPPRGKSSTNASVGNTTSNSLVRSNKTKSGVSQRPGGHMRRKSQKISIFASSNPGGASTPANANMSNFS